MQRAALIVTAADFANLSLLQARGPLQRALEHAAVVASNDIPPDVVTMNSRVVLVDEATAECRLVTLAYPVDAIARADAISVLKPLGMALLGASPGDIFEYRSADGEHRVRMAGIVYQPERDLRTRLVLRGTQLQEHFA